MPTKKLPKSVTLLGWVSFFADISSEMIYPLLPIFLVGVLGAPAFALGLIEGVTQAIVSVLSALSGIISDRSRKRVAFVRWGYGLPILGKFLISLAGSWPIVFFGRAIDRFGKGLRGSPRDALIAEAIDAEQRGQAFGFHRSMDTAGAFVGVLIAATALWLLEGRNIEIIYRLVFGLAVLSAFCSFMVTFLVDEDKTFPNDAAHKKQTTFSSQPTRFALNGLGREYWLTLLILTIFAFANSSDAFLLLRAGDAGLNALQVVLVYALYNFSYALFSYSAGKLSDSRGRWRVICLGWGIYALVYAGVAITANYLIWGLFAIYGIYMALTEGVSKALVVDCVPPEKKGTALGLLYMALGASALSSNLLAGYLWDNFGKSVPFWMGSFSALIAIFITFCSGRIGRPNSTKII